MVIKKLGWDAFVKFHKNLWDDIAIKEKLIMADKISIAIVENKKEGLYIVVESYDFCIGLEELVNEKILEGYRPIGGVCITSGGNYLQAMIHNEL